MATRDELWGLFSKLPSPSSRYFVDLNERAEMEQQGADAEVLVHRVERRRLAARVDRKLAHALEGLGDEDRVSPSACARARAAAITSASSWSVVRTNSS